VRCLAHALPVLPVTAIEGSPTNFACLYPVARLFADYGLKVLAAVGLLSILHLFSVKVTRTIAGLIDAEILDSAFIVKAVQQLSLDR
jgi:hypothetical protein